MLKLLFTLIYDELDRDTGDQSESNSSCEDIIIGFSSILVVLEYLVDGERRRGNVKNEAGVLSGCPKDGCIHILRVQTSYILTRHVEESNNVVLVL